MGVSQSTTVFVQNPEVPWSLADLWFFVPCLESRNSHHSRGGDPEPRIETPGDTSGPFLSEHLSFPQSMPKYKLGGPYPWDQSSLSFPMSLFAVLKVTLHSFLLLLKPKWWRQLTSVAFSVPQERIFRIIEFALFQVLFSRGQPAKTNAFGFINEHLPLHGIYCGERPGASQHFWKWSGLGEKQ